MKYLSLLLFAIGLVGSTSGCVAVKSYEREHLADRIMDFEAVAAEVAMDRHFLETREGSSGGQGGAGGGCACN